MLSSEPYINEVTDS